jgi:hypothetical protein
MVNLTKLIMAFYANVSTTSGLVLFLLLNDRNYLNMAGHLYLLRLIFILFKGTLSNLCELFLHDLEMLDLLLITSEPVE